MRQATVRLGAALFALALTLPVGAQIATTLRADIPFEFTVGLTTMPAGHYEIDTMAGRGSVILRGEGGSTNVMSLPESVFNPATRRTTLIFNKYGDQYFLAQVRTEDAVHSLPASKVERELQRSAAASPGKEIVIAMR
jgi:hypothetical protein